MSQDFQEKFVIWKFVTTVCMGDALMELAAANQTGRVQLVILDSVQIRAVDMALVREDSALAAQDILVRTVEHSLALKLAQETVNVTQAHIFANASEDSMELIVRKRNVPTTVLVTVSAMELPASAFAQITGVVMTAVDTLARTTALTMESAMKRLVFASVTIGGKDPIAASEFV